MRRKVLFLALGALLIGTVIATIPGMQVAALRNKLAIQVSNADQEQGDSSLSDTSLQWTVSTLQEMSDSWSTRRLLGYYYIRSRQGQLAASVLGAGTAGCPDPITCLEQGNALYQLGQRSEAIAKWRSVPNTDIYFAFLGDNAYEQGDKGKALQFYRISRDIAQSPAWAKATMFLNLCRDRRGDQDMEAAVYWCQQAVASKGDYWTRLELGRTYYESRQYELAEQTLREAIPMSPNTGSAYRWLGLTLYRMGQEHEGLDALHTSIYLNPKDVWSHLALADVLRSRGEHLQAACEYIRALELTDQATLWQTIEERMRSLSVPSDQLQQCESLPGE